MLQSTRETLAFLCENLAQVGGAKQANSILHSRPRKKMESLTLNLSGLFTGLRIRNSQKNYWADFKVMCLLGSSGASGVGRHERGTVVGVG